MQTFAWYDRQTTVDLSKVAVFGVSNRHIFGTFRDDAQITIIMSADSTYRYLEDAYEISAHTSIPCH